MDHIALNASTQFKNSSDMVLYLQSDEYVGPELPIMPKNLTENDKKMWEYKMNDLVKIEHLGPRFR